MKIDSAKVNENYIKIDKDADSASYDQSFAESLEVLFEEFLDSIFDANSRLSREDFVGKIQQDFKGMFEPVKIRANLDLKL